MIISTRVSFQAMWSRLLNYEKKKLSNLTNFLSNNKFELDNHIACNTV
jgi:hypothetical protein